MTSAAVQHMERQVIAWLEQFWREQMRREREAKEAKEKKSA